MENCFPEFVGLDSFDTIGVIETIVIRNSRQDGIIQRFSYLSNRYPEQYIPRFASKLGVSPEVQ